MSYEMITRKGIPLLDVASALQKSIRRNDQKLAGWMALELFHSGFANYCWKRLLTISAEDVHGLITKEIYALYKSWEFVNKNRKGDLKGRIFLSKATLILAAAPKNRDSDHLQNLVYDKNLSITDKELEDLIKGLENIDRVKMPDYVFDVHTKRGKLMGKTKDQFMKDELNALSPRQKGIFDDLVQ